ncbi:MAG: hypothetical protein OS112_08750 [Methanoregula sp.]|nr:MAG: hypothetical protein OS112_08750 [Methanoregula sp.]
MVFVPDLVSMINTILCVIIVILGILVYTRNGEMSALLIGIAFGLFGISHIYTILGFGISWEGALITARTCGYILVIAALYLFLTSGNKKDYG